MVDQSRQIDLGGMDLVVRDLYVNAATPGAAGTDIGTTDLTALAGITAGTTSASKAVIVDASKNVSGLGVSRTVTAAGSTKTLAATNNTNVVQLDTAGGSAVILPAATGSGVSFLFYVSALATSAAHTVTAAGSDNFVGVITGERTDSGNAALGFAAASNSNTITLNRTTTGSVNKGEWFDVVDVATNVWLVRGNLSATGAAFATPFSHV